ncbi:MAG: DUF362 domain-containing protein [Deltaproteobacteria bacterium]|nr:DUF362 domain-containing protein [Deltaproteobacteria bacterium]
MTVSRVYFIDLRASAKENLPSKLSNLLETAGLSDVIEPRNIVAIKLHFGEKGNTAFIRPVFLRRIVEQVKSLEAKPFLTDTNTLYAGTRSDSLSHLVTAVENGFAYSVVNAPLIIADGIRGGAFFPVGIDKKWIKTAFIGTDIAEADALISVAHFKGHELTGFGGTLKNVGMGCASRKGKLEQHSGLCPKVKTKKCVGCGDCVDHCAHHAIALKQEKAAIASSRCVGCGECILICPNGAIEVQWDRDIVAFQEKLAEYTFAVLKEKQGKALFINFLTGISPACDCCGHSDAPIVRDIGIVASTDPVAIDQASVDLVNQQRAAHGTSLKTSLGPGEDKFKGLYPKVDWRTQLMHAERLGLGSRSYDLNIAEFRS